MTELASIGQLRGSLLRWALVLVPVVLLLGILSVQVGAGGPGNPWFAGLIKPALYPAPALFALASIVLYILMGLALATIAAARGARWRPAALAAFALQLVFALVWPPVFFAGHRIVMALLLLIALDLVLVATIILFRMVRPLAALLMVPCLAWTMFATLLTWQLHAANPGADGKAVSGAVTRIEI